MRKATGRALGLAALMLTGFGSGAGAQDTVRVRGTIDRLEGPLYVVKARDGAELGTAVHEYRHGVMDTVLATSGRPLPPDWARPSCRPLATHRHNGPPLTFAGITRRM